MYLKLETYWKHESDKKTSKENIVELLTYHNDEPNDAEVWFRPSFIRFCKNSGNNSLDEQNMADKIPQLNDHLTRK